MTNEDIERFIATWPRQRFSDIRYAECVQGPASPEEELRNDGSRAVRTFFVQWFNRLEFMTELLGYPEISSIYHLDGSAAGIFRKVPDAHPNFFRNGKPFLFATQVLRCEPWGVPPPFPNEDLPNMRDRSQLPDATDIAAYAFAKIQVLYETPTYEVVPDDQMARDAFGYPAEYNLTRFVTKYIQAAASAFTIPTATLRYVDHATPASTTVVPGYPSIIEPKSDLILIWHHVPQAAVGMRLINPTAPVFPIDKSIGKVNKETFAGLPAGTVLLDNVSPKPIRSAVGDRLWDLEFRFKFFNPVAVQVTNSTGTSVDRQTVGHNHILYWKAGATSISYAEITIDGTTNLVNKTAGKNPHDWYDFNFCFRVPTTKLIVAGA
jgi:hypothetical protein